MKHKTKLYIGTIVGVLITGIGIGLFRYVGFGIDPYSTMISGISNTFNTSYGTIQMCCAAFLFLFQYIFQRKSIGLGTALNLIFIGYISDFALYIFQIITLPSTYIFKIIWIILDVILIGIGMGLYMSTKLGIAPYDSLAFIISEKKQFTYSTCRICMDLLCLIIGLCLGAPIGITTVVMMMGTGPLVSFFCQQFEKALES